MKTYIGFKRSIVDPVTGETRSEIKFVPVDIPELDSREGWKMIGSADSISVLDPCSTESVEQQVIPEFQQALAPLQNGDSFESLTTGTARLVRLKNEIKITYRKGKKTLNQTSPNSVCIDELTKNQFFADCRRAFGRDSEYFRFSTYDKEYEYWNGFMDREYQKQLKAVNELRAKG